MPASWSKNKNGQIWKQPHLMLPIPFAKLEKLYICTGKWSKSEFLSTSRRTRNDRSVRAVDGAFHKNTLKKIIQAYV